MTDGFGDCAEMGPIYNSICMVSNSLLLQSIEEIEVIWSKVLLSGLVIIILVSWTSWQRVFLVENVRQPSSLYLLT